MNKKEFKRIARILKEAYKEIEKEALEGGLDIFSKEYDNLILMSRAKILEKLGYTVEQYLEAKEQIATLNKTDTEDLAKRAKSFMEQGKETLSNLHNSTKEKISEMTNRAKILSKPKVIKETIEKVIIEKPTTIHTTNDIHTTNEIIKKEKFNAKPLYEKIDILNKKVDKIKIPDVESIFQKNFKKNIDTLGMPDFRKLAMGLQSEIDKIKATAEANLAADVEGPASSTNNNFAAFDGTTGKLIKDSGSSASTFATAAQGALADSALQSGDNISELTNDSGYITSVSGGDHGTLSGLTDDDHTQYALLLGRSGGQTLIGGTGASDGLLLQSTSHATKGLVALGSLTTGLIYDGVNSRVGIGTASPSSKLDVTTNSLGTTQTTTSGLALVNTTAAGAGAQQISPALRWSGYGWKTDATAASQAVDFRSYVVPVEGTANPTGYLTFESSINGGAYTANQLVLTSAGNVGIGITSPSAFLHTLGTTEQFRIGYDASNAHKFTQSSANSLTIAPLVNSTSSVNFTTAGGTSILNIDSTNAKVGILNTTPSVALEIGTASVANQTLQMNSLSANMNFQITTDGGGGVTNLIANNISTGNASLAFQVSSGGTESEAMRIRYTGNVGIGTTTPSAKLHILGTTEQFRIGYNASNAHKFTMASANQLTITPLVNSTTSTNFTNAAGTTIFNIDSSNGRVGIGTTSPTAVLHLKAGTATANTAPLKLTTGTVNTTAEAGAVEYNNTFHVTNSDATRRHIATAPNTTKVTAGAPYTNDGYIVINIGGTDFKVMTTA